MSLKHKLDETEQNKLAKLVKLDNTISSTKMSSNGVNNVSIASQTSINLDHTAKCSNITYQNSKITYDQRLSAFANSTNQNGCTIWLTGLSCSGKTTIGFALEDYLIRRKSIATYCLDGDNIRHGLNSNLGFSQHDRSENIRRIGEVSKLFADAGIVCITSFISPFHSDRNRVRAIHEASNLNFVEVFIDTPLEVCEQRDVKGLYKKARAGIVKDFTGIDSPYETPNKPEIVIHTTKKSIEQCVLTIVDYLEKNNILSKKETIDLSTKFLTNSNEMEMKSRELFIEDKPEMVLLREMSESFYKIDINTIEMQWIQVLSEGWAHPLRGFMTEDEYLQCLHFNSIKIDGKLYNQSVPIVLSCTDEDRKKLLESNDLKEVQLCLTYKQKKVAVMHDIEIYPHRKEERCARQFGLCNIGHPYQKFIHEECGNWLIGGKLKVFERVKWNDGLDDYRLTPVELRKRFDAMKADAVFAFQLRNPIHNGHALLMKDTRQLLLDKGYANPVLLLHPLGGWTKDDDAPLSVRIEQHKAVLEDGHFLDANSTIMAIFPSPMMYAGPTEVQWHAKTRMNTGAQYYIVGRDPAGMPHPDTKADIYDATHGARVLQMAPGLNELKIIPFKVAAYNKSKKSMDYYNPKEHDNFEFISGTKMRKLAREGQSPPDGFMVDKAWSILADYYKNLAK